MRFLIDLKSHPQTRCVISLLGEQELRSQIFWLKYVFKLAYSQLSDQLKNIRTINWIILFKCFGSMKVRSLLENEIHFMKLRYYFLKLRSHLLKLRSHLLNLRSHLFNLRSYFLSEISSMSLCLFTSDYGGLCDTSGSNSLIINSAILMREYR